MSALSVIIPARNEEARLASGLARLVREGPLEIIVVDGESTDRTVEVARGAGARVVGASLGRGRQMNAGARIASGEQLLFLHADTVLPSGFST